MYALYIMNSDYTHLHSHPSHVKGSGRRKESCKWSRQTRDGSPWIFLFKYGSQIMWGQRAGHSSLASTKPCKIFVIPFTFQQLFRISEGNLRVWIKTYRGVHCFSRSSTTSCPSMVGGAFNYELSVIHGASFNIHFKYINFIYFPSGII